MHIEDIKQAVWGLVDGTIAFLQTQMKVVFVLQLKFIVEDFEQSLGYDQI
jgi:hypothetical protein